MNIACIACPARYAVPDDKIAGRKVRITCKRCGTVLIVDGTSDPPAVRGEGARSQPPPELYLLALTEVEREEADPAKVVELFASGRVNPQTLAWQKGMSTWLTLFEIEPLARALRQAGFSDLEVQEAAPAASGSSAYDDDDEEEATRIQRSPLEEQEEDEATSVLDTESMSNMGWNEPASWRGQKRQNPLSPGDWVEHQAIEAPEKSKTPLAGSWQEHGLEDDDVTRMVAPLDEQLEPAEVAPTSRGPLPPLPLPPPASVRRAKSLPPRPPRKSTAPAAATHAHDAGPGPFDFSEQPASGGEAALAAELALLAPPAPQAADPELKPPATTALVPVQPAPRRGSGRRIALALLLAIGAVLGVLYASGRFSLVTQGAQRIWQALNPNAR